MYSCAGPRIVQIADPFPDFTDCTFLGFAACFGCRWTGRSVQFVSILFSKAMSKSRAYRIARYNRLPSRISSIGAVSGFSGGLAVVTNPPASSRIAIPAATSLFPVNINSLNPPNLETNSPLPTTPLPPNIKSPHSSIRQIQRRTPQTAHAMHHPTPPIPPTNLSSHIDKTLDLAMHIAVWDIAAVLAPLAAEDALRGRVRGHGRDGGLVD